ncbi:MAG: TPM domain-containing protein [Prevotella sp.]|nr:TPM domain-containing protein [Prevotella sp.]
MLLVFTIMGLVLIGFVTYGFAVVNNKPTKVEGPTREEEVNKLTDVFNSQVSTLKTEYKEKKKELKGKDAELKELKADITKSYDSMRKDYNQQVAAVTTPPTQKNPVRAFWNKVFYGGILASFTCCLGSGIYAVDNEVKAPEKLVNTTEVWSADNIPMPHLEDENQYLANPDKVLSKESVDSINTMLQRMDKELGIETAFVVVNYCQGGDAFRLAQDMGNKYGVGRNDRGLVVVMAYGDHDINISPGSGLESTLTDNKCGRLLDEYAVPFLKDGQPDSAMLYLTRALLEVLKDQDELSPVYEEPLNDEDRDLGIVGVGTMGIWGVLGLLRRKLKKKGLMKENITPLKTAMPNPTIELINSGIGAGSTYGSSRRDRDDRSSRSSWSSGSSSRGGSYGGGHFGGGGASRKW